MHTEFFTRFDGLSMVPGYKAAGFDFVISTAALIRLSKIKVTPEQQRSVTETARTRIAQSGLAPKKLGVGMGIWFLNDTACPRVFSQDSAFGGSVGADPETFSRLDHEDALEYIGDSVVYSPHNIDSPKQAFITFMLCQAWAEWAVALLNAQEYQASFARSAKHAEAV